MSSHKDFIQKFRAEIPQFMQNDVVRIYNDITEILTQGLKKDGVEIRSFFSMNAQQHDQRHRITCKDLSK
ncbi:MAG: hypothetical protein ACI9CD_000486 [Candidatus Deianiraeaceae bacterium]|jgi:hypothetical protein